MSLTRYEQEVSINLNAAEDTADLYTANPVWIRRMDKLVEANPEQFKVVETGRCNGEIISKTYRFPKRFVYIRGKDITRELTDEQRQEMAERLRRIRNKDKAGEAEENELFEEIEELGEGTEENTEEA